jgi:hypothetical protein
MVWQKRWEARQVEKGADDGSSRRGSVTDDGGQVSVDRGRERSETVSGSQGRQRRQRRTASSRPRARGEEWDVYVGC